MGNELKITFQLSQKDVYRANVAIAVDGLRRLRTIVGLIIIELLAVVAVVGSVLAPGTAGSGLLLIIGVLSSALFFPAVVLCTCYVTPYWAAKSVCKNNANLRSPIHWSFSEELITQRMATGSAELFWSTFTKARETLELFLLYPQRNLAYPVPKRAFANEQEVAAFRELVRRPIQDVR
jgi:hypothetical protein